MEVPTKVPPHDVVYHFQLAAVPNEPPFTLSVKLLPGVAIATDGVIDVGATLNEFTTGVTLNEVAEHPNELVTETETGVALLTAVVCVVAPFDQL